MGNVRILYNGKIAGMSSPLAAWKEINVIFTIGNPYTLPCCFLQFFF